MDIINKKIKFVTVNEETGILKIYFTDLTFVKAENIEIIIEGKE